MPRLSRRNVRKGGKRRVRRGGDDDEEEGVPAAVKGLAPGA